MNADADMFGLPEDEALRQQILDQVGGEVATSKWAKTLVDYVQVVEDLLFRRGVEREQAFKQAADIVLELAEFRGGRAEYLPRGDALRTALRHAEIYRRAKAGNYDALATEYGLTTIQVYRIVREQGVLHRAKIQGNLFPPKGD